MLTRNGDPQESSKLENFDLENLRRLFARSAKQFFEKWTVPR
jgi:hypothetical protein